MRLLLNILWITVGGGAALALQYLVGGLLLCLTVVGIPFGMQCFKLARLSLLPFGHEVEDDPTLPGSGFGGLLANIFWFIFGGATTFLTHLGFGLANAVTIIGIPFALQHLKLAVLSLFPFGRKIVDAD
jgi:uncharacterized membrane protein YccF (DUF307 family)